VTAALVVYIKEVRENLRDRRALSSAILTGLMTPLLLTVLIQVMITRERDKQEKPLEVPVIGAERAPNLMRELTSLGLKARAPISDPEAAVVDQREDAVLRIPTAYAEHFRKGEPAEVELLYDASRQDGDSSARRLRQMIEQIAQREAAMRLVARGISPRVTTPIAVVDRDVSTAQSRSQLIFGMLPYIFVLAAFAGGLYVAIDTTAGERERQSLEPLFANPATRTQILLGKLGATFTFSLLSLALSMAAFSVAARFMPTEELGMVFEIGPRFVIGVLVVMLPIVALLGTLQTLVSGFAKSFREAQTYLSFLMIVPVIPSVLLAIIPIKGKLWMYAVPLLGQQLTIMRLVRGEPLDAAQLSLCVVTTFIAAAIVGVVTAHIYKSERLAIST
jgi:sodium transport system permease protein